MPDYKTHDPKGFGGDPKRKAAMGRHSYHLDKDFAGKIYLRRVYLNSQGYDSNGTYFGVGKPLYWYANEEGTIDAVLRAWIREEARQEVLKLYPKAKIRR